VLNPASQHHCTQAKDFNERLRETKKNVDFKDSLKTLGIRYGGGLAMHFKLLRW
jgi:hypothetical protein